MNYSLGIQQLAEFSDFVAQNRVDLAVFDSGVDIHHPFCAGFRGLPLHHQFQRRVVGQGVDRPPHHPVDVVQWDLPPLVVIGVAVVADVAIATNRQLLVVPVDLEVFLKDIDPPFGGLGEDPFVGVHLGVAGFDSFELFGQRCGLGRGGELGKIDTHLRVPLKDNSTRQTEVYIFPITI